MERDMLHLLVAAIDEELKTNADEANLWFERGRLLSQLGEQQAAMESLRRAVALNPALVQKISGEFKKS